MAIPFATSLPRRPRRRMASLALAAILAPALAAAQPATITGEVLRAVPLSPLAGITVVLTDYLGPDRTYTTDGTGNFVFTGLAAGTYHLYTRNDLGYTNEIYNDVLCPLTCRTGDYGSPIVLTPGAVFHASVVLDRGASITGTVTDAVTSTPLPGASLYLYGFDTSDPPAEIEAETETDAGGAYTFQGLPAGRYYVMAHVPGYADELYDNATCCHWVLWSGAGTPIQVALGQVSGGRNFALDPGGHVTGVVADAATAAPIDGACVYVVRIVAGQVLIAGAGCADSTGAYDVGELPGGTYYAWAYSTASGHISALYGNFQCLLETCLRLPASVAGSPAITVAAGATTPGKNFALVPGGRIQGVVRNAGTAAPLPNKDVWVVTRLAGSAVQVGYAATNTAGEYSVGGLPSGTYYAYMNDSPYSLIYNGFPCPGGSCTQTQLSTTGTPIAVTAGNVTPGVDFGVRRDVPPPTPDGLRATVANYAVTLSWYRPSLDPMSFVLEAGLTPGTTIVTLQTTAQSYVVFPVGPGRYYVRVRAVNAYGPSPPSKDVLVVVAPNGADGAPPTAPTNLRGWMSGTRLTLTWSAYSTGGPPTGYLVEVGSATGLTNIATLLVSAPALTYLPVPPGVYFVRVRAVNAAGVSPPSLEVKLRAGTVPSPPYAPWNVAFTVSGSTVTLKWVSPPWQAAVTGYLVHAGSAPGLSNLAQVGTGASTSVVFGGVPPGTYYVRVHAVNGQGASIASDEVTVVVP